MGWGRGTANEVIFQSIKFIPRRVETLGYLGEQQCQRGISILDRNAITARRQNFSRFYHMYFALAEKRSVRHITILA